MIKRVAALLGVVVFLVAGSVGASYAYWAATSDVSATVRTSDPATANCSNIVSLTNGDFEADVIPDNAWRQPSSMTGWTSQAPGTSTARVFELWRGSVIGGITPQSGSQNIELNSNGPATVYQQLATTPGQVLHWSFWHRGRDSATVGDQLKLTIGAPTPNSADASATVTTNPFAQIFTTTNAAWAYYSGSYTVPAGQTTTRLSFTSVTTGGGDVMQANILDGVSFGTGPCVGASSTISNVTTGGTVYRVGDTVRIVTTIANTGGAAAAASVARVVLPANLDLVAGSIRIGAVSMTDAAADDQADYLAGTRTIAARIGGGATATTGGYLTNGGPVTVSYDAVIGVGAASGTITHTPSVEFLDAAVGSWPLSVTGATLSRNVGAAADVAVTVLSQPVVTASGAATWSFRVTNNGPSAATGVVVALTLANGPSYATSTFTTTHAGAATSNCTGTGLARSCAIGAIPAGEGRTVTVTGTFGANPTSLYPVTATASTTSYDHVGANNAATSTGTDGVAPNAPTAVEAQRLSSTAIRLSWNVASDPVGTVVGYHIYRNGILLNPGVLTTGTSFDDTVGTNSLNWYWIVAEDDAGNLSAPSAGSGAVAYVTGTTNVSIHYPGGAGLCLGASGTSTSSDVEIRTACAGNSTRVNWGLTASTTPGNSARILLTGTTNRNWLNATSGGIKFSSNSSNYWKLDVQWDGTNPYLRIASGTSNSCATVTTTAEGANLAMTTCSTATTQRFTLGAW